MTRPEPRWALENSYAALPELLFERRVPAPVAAPSLLLWNAPLAARLGLPTAPPPVEWLSGNALPTGADPIAQAYAGHQFGSPNMLGDGRAVLLGEQVAPDGARFDIGLKGSGRTRYSRGGDGRAALGPMLREYIISEAMAALGVPTTRSLAVVASGEPVLRDFILPGAVLVRVAASHIRVGTFQFAAAQDDPAALKALADHAMARHWPALPPGDYPGFLASVVGAQARLVADWLLIGFVHGVMNTDNMTISGETIDYGPCAFLESYGRETVFSSIDHGGRYAYGNQPRIALWNLSRFAETLLPLFGLEPEAAVAQAQGLLAGFQPVFEAHWLGGMRAKLGLAGEAPGDEALVAAVLDWLETDGRDFTNFFRSLADALESGIAIDAPWWAEWLARLADPVSAAAAIRRAAPAVIPRNHMVEGALQAAEAGEMGPAKALLEALSDPWSETAANAPFRQPATAEQAVRQTFCGT